MLSNHLWLPCAVLPCADIEYLHCHIKFYPTALIYSNNFLIFSTDISVHNSVPSLVSLKWALDLELSSSLIFTTLYQLSLVEMISQVLMWFCLIWQFWSVDTAAWTEARRIQRLVLDSGGKAKACEPRGRAATWVLRLWQVLTRHPRHGGCPASLSARGLEWLWCPLGRQTWQAWVACMHAKSLQLCPTLCDPTDYSPPGSFVHEVSQARILECVAISFSRGSSWPRDGTWVSLYLLHLRLVLTTSTPWEAPGRPGIRVSQNGKYEGTPKPL